MTVWLVVLAATVGFLIGRWRFVPWGPRATPSSDAAGSGSSTPDDSSELYGVVAAVESFFNASAQPSDLLGNSDFESGVSLLSSRPVETLLDYYTGDSAIIACMALETLARRHDQPDFRGRILGGINDYAPWNRFFALRVLDAWTPPANPIVGRLLVSLDDSWGYPLNLRFLVEFLSTRAERGERLTLGDHAQDFDQGSAEALVKIFDRIPDALAAGLKEELATWQATRVDQEFLDSIGRIWKPDPDNGESPILVHEALESDVSRIEEAILREPRRSVLLVGEHGVGKTAAARLLARNLAKQGWTVFESPAERRRIRPR